MEACAQYGDFATGPFFDWPYAFPWCHVAMCCLSETYFCSPWCCCVECCIRRRSQYRRQFRMLSFIIYSLRLSSRVSSSLLRLKDWCWMPIVVRSLGSCICALDLHIKSPGWLCRWVTVRIVFLSLDKWRFLFSCITLSRSLQYPFAICDAGQSTYAVWDFELCLQLDLSPFPVVDLCRGVNGQPLYVMACYSDGLHKKGEPPPQPHYLFNFELWHEKLLTNISS